MREPEFREFAIAHVLADSNQIVGVVDPAMVLRWISPSASKYGLDAVGSSIIDLIHPEDLARAAQAFDGTAQSDGFAPSLMAHALIPIRIMTRDGMVPFDTSGQWVTDADGSSWLVAVLHDVTSRYATDQAVRKLAARADDSESIQAVLTACKEYGGVQGAEMFWTSGNRVQTLGDLHADTSTSVEMWESFADLAKPGRALALEGSDWSYALPVLAGTERLGAMIVWGVGPAADLALVSAAMGPLLDLAALALKRAYELADLRRRASTDQVTGLLNRHAFFSQLDQIVQQAAVVYIDLDEFKSVNDQFGHTLGDRLLNVVGRRLSDAVGSNDDTARIGGDEFAVLCRSVTPAQARETGERIVDALNQTFVIDGHRVETGASLGIAYTDTSTTGRALLDSADQALLEAKAQGKGRAVVVSSF